MIEVEANHEGVSIHEPMGARLDLTAEQAEAVAGAITTVLGHLRRSADEPKPADQRPQPGDIWGWRGINYRVLSVTGDGWALLEHAKWGWGAKEPVVTMADPKEGWTLVERDGKPTATTGA